MARTPLLLPRELTESPFHLSRAEKLGIGAHVLRHARFDRPFAGVRRLKRDADPQRDPIVTLAESYVPVLRVSAGEVFSHETALRLYGAPIRSAAVVHLAIPHPHGPAQRRGTQGHRLGEISGTRLLQVPGSGAELPCVAPEHALLQAAVRLPFRELVVAIDHFVKLVGPPGRASAFMDLEMLRQFADEASGRGVRRLRAALRVARIGAESRMETLQHFELASMGLDTLELQAEITDDQGRWIGRFDSADREKRKLLWADPFF